MLYYKNSRIQHIISKQTIYYLQYKKNYSMLTKQQSIKAITDTGEVSQGSKSEKENQSLVQTRFEQADTFLLRVDLGEDTLKIVLKDYEQWKQYSKTYTREDIGDGKQINRRIDLYDIYCSLIPNTEDDEGYVETKEIKRILRKYKYGNIIQNNTSQFSINAGGCIKVWVKVMFRRNNKVVQETVLSTLILDQVGTYNENDKFKVRFELQNRFFKEQYQYELDNLKTEHHGIQQKFDKLQYEINQLKEQNLNLKQVKKQLQKEMEEFQKYKKQNELNKQIINMQIQKIVNETVAQKQLKIKAQVTQEMNAKIKEAMNILRNQMDLKLNQHRQILTQEIKKQAQCQQVPPAEIAQQVQNKVQQPPQPQP